MQGVAWRCVALTLQLDVLNTDSQRTRSRSRPESLVRMTTRPSRPFLVASNNDRDGKRRLVAPSDLARVDALVSSDAGVAAQVVQRELVRAGVVGKEHGGQRLGDGGPGRN